MRYYARYDLPMPVICWRKDEWIKSLCGVTPAPYHVVSLAVKKIFKIPGQKQNKKHPALVEVFNEKQAAKHFTQGEAFNSAQHTRS